MTGADPSVNHSETSESDSEELFNKEDLLANINVINIDNLFNDDRERKYATKLSYDDYQMISEDFYTFKINEDIIAKMEGFGFSWELIVHSIHHNELNHATATYNLLLISDK